MHFTTVLTRILYPFKIIPELNRSNERSKTTCSRVVRCRLWWDNAVYAGIVSICNIL